MDVIRSPDLGLPETRSRRSASADWVAVAVGSFLGAAATGVGAGLAVRHLQKAGLSLVAMLGLLLVVAGLAALIWSILKVWRTSSPMRHTGWVRAVALVCSAAVVLGLGSSAALATMYSFVPPTRLGTSTTADYGFATRDVTVRAADGVQLSAWWAPGANRSAVVLLHGAGSTRTATLPHASVLARHGFGVLLLDSRGHGRSRGRGMDLGWYGDRDVAAALSFLSHQPDVDPNRIGLLGLSMGGEEAIGAAAAEPRVRVVVAEGATARTRADKAAWLPGGVAGAAQRGLDDVTYGLTALLSRAPEPEPLVRSIERSQAPMLLITAGTMPDEARAAAGFSAAAPARVTTWNVPGASHTAGLARDPAGWEARVVDFFRQGLDVHG